MKVLTYLITCFLIWTFLKVGLGYAESRQPFDETKHQQTWNEVADVANGAYDRKFERGQRGGISMYKR